ncbi:MAG: response regulator transcription factor [Roseiflexaceae bacterium]
MLKILIVEDEARLGRLIREYLIQAGFQATLLGDGAAALEHLRNEPVDLVILDLMLPGIDGFELCRRLRTFSDVYVLMLTAKAEEIDRVLGLEIGADDYLTKPFSPRELVARVRALLRRPRSPAYQPTPLPPPSQFGPLQIDHARHQVRRDGQLLALTNIEYALLLALTDQPGRTLTRHQLLDRVWGTDYYGDDHVIDVHIANLRKKLGDDPAQPRFIITVRGVGYRFGDLP